MITNPEGWQGRCEPSGFGWVHASDIRWSSIARPPANGWEPFGFVEHRVSLRSTRRLMAGNPSGLLWMLDRRLMPGSQSGSLWMRDPEATDVGLVGTD